MSAALDREPLRIEGSDLGPGDLWLRATRDGDQKAVSLEAKARRHIDEVPPEGGRWRAETVASIAPEGDDAAVRVRAYTVMRWAAGVDGETVAAELTDRALAAMRDVIERVAAAEGGRVVWKPGPEAPPPPPERR